MDRLAEYRSPPDRSRGRHDADGDRHRGAAPRQARLPQRPAPHECRRTAGAGDPAFPALGGARGGRDHGPAHDGGPGPRDRGPVRPHASGACRHVPTPQLSRLFDGLARLDRGRARPAEMGGIALPTRRVRGRRTWRIVGSFIILVGMAAIAWTAYVRPPGRDYLASPVPAQITKLPSIPPAPSPLAQGLEAAQRGGLADAERLFREAIARDERDAEAWNGLGVVLIRQGEREGGIDALRTTLRLVPT